MTPQQVMDTHAKSFSWAARFLSASTRRDAAQLYAFARLADDLADEEALGTLNQRMEQLQALELGVLCPDESDELGQQVGQMLQAKGVSTDVIRYFMASLLIDTGPRRIQTTEELLQFAYGVAGTIGQMMCPILGASKQGQTYAVAMGVAMQLTNIARDVVEDAARGRCYIPAKWGVNAQALHAPRNWEQAEQCFAAIRKLLQLADEFYAYSLQGLNYIPAGNRHAIYIAMSLYRGIGQKILKQGARRYWQGRTSLGRVEKIKLIIGCYLGIHKLHSASVRDVVADDLQHLTTVPGFPAIG